MAYLDKEGKLGQESTHRIYGPHRVVVLYDSAFPRKTVLVVPITSQFDSKGNSKRMIPTDVPLEASVYHDAGFTYSGTIEADSYIKTEQIMAISRAKLEDKYGELMPIDMASLDIQLISTLRLQNTVNQFVQDKVAEKLAELGIENDVEQGD
jgi:mRNA-degrading endonuclease toxin of MazEF toxin-antitoxin module